MSLRGQTFQRDLRGQCIEEELQGQNWDQISHRQVKTEMELREALLRLES